jgi:hypothetical protein
VSVLDRIPILFLPLPYKSYGAGVFRSCPNPYRGIPVNSLTAKDVHDRPLFEKLLWCLASSPIFVHCQRLIARKIAELFSSNCAMSQFYKASSIDDVSRGSVLCLFAASFGGAIFTVHCHNLEVVCANTDDPGGYRGNTV